MPQQFNWLDHQFHDARAESVRKDGWQPCDAIELRDFNATNSLGEKTSYCCVVEHLIHPLPRSGHAECTVVVSTVWSGSKVDSSDNNLPRVCTFDPHVPCQVGQQETRCLLRNGLVQSSNCRLSVPRGWPTCRALLPTPQRNHSRRVWWTTAIATSMPRRDKSNKAIYPPMRWCSPPSSFNPLPCDGGNWTEWEWLYLFLCCSRTIPFLLFLPPTSAAAAILLVLVTVLLRLCSNNSSRGNGQSTIDAETRSNDCSIEISTVLFFNLCCSVVNSWDPFLAITFIAFNS